MFTKTIAETMAKERPDRYVATMAKRARGARIFVDYLRNDRGATAVAAYSTRALPRASVSTPLNWDELSPGLRSDHFTVGNVLHRLSSLKQDPWQGFFKICQRLPQGSSKNAPRPERCAELSRKRLAMRSPPRKWKAKPSMA